MRDPYGLIRLGLIVYRSAYSDAAVLVFVDADVFQAPEMLSRPLSLDFRRDGRVGVFRIGSNRR